MRADQASITAERNSFVRAAEKYEPRSLRLFNDPYAHIFLGDDLSRILISARKRNELLESWEKAAPGVCGSVLVRTRFIDDCLLSCLTKGIKQLVILGAGYDTRPYRFKKLLDGITVFEVDYPSTQEIKRSRLSRSLRSHFCPVEFVPIDFQRQNVAQVLAEHGYDPSLKTLFIWEGVTYYLTSQAVYAMLHFMAKHSGVNSTVVFDFFTPAVAEGTCHLPESIAMRAALANMGEAITFGIEPEYVDTFLLKRGFYSALVADHKQCRGMYLSSSKRAINLSAMFYFVRAETIKRNRITDI